MISWYQHSLRNYNLFLREILNPVSNLKGAGPQVSARLARLGIINGADLLLFPPRSYEDRSVKRKLADFAAGPVNCRVVVISHDWFGFGRMKTLKIWVMDEEGTKAALICFNRPFLEQSFPVGQKMELFGRFGYKYAELQSSGFDAEAVPEGQNDNTELRKGALRAVYPLTEGLNQASLRKLVSQALKLWAFLEDEIPPSLRNKRKLLPKAEALRKLHKPESMAEALEARRSLAYEELFYLQIMVAKRALARRLTMREARLPDNSLVSAMKERLGFELTPDQQKALADIFGDMSGPWPMARLLQGDVGSGKTLVAFFAALYAVSAGEQAALMAPTELLARQHADTAARLLEPLGIRLAYLSGNVADSARKPLLAALAKGEVDFIIGTHALFSQDVEFRSLRLVIVDEQQRFGVLQRMALGSKGSQPDMLMMTATPIPRTLALTVFGDLSVSTIKTMPPGRLPIITHLARTGNEEKVYEFVRKQMALGKSAYFVYPLVENSDKLELKNAEAMYEKLSKQLYPEFRGALIHARLPEEEKRKTMLDFSTGKLSFIAATSVVEVGVDVPRATCMVIEHAERFGLAALHQLRGRVGRGLDQSYCFLVWSEKLGEEGKQRIMAMKNMSDGFEIAEEDLKIRGPGEISGTAQAGALKLVFTDFAKDAELLEEARMDARVLMETDPDLISKEGSIVSSVLKKANPFSGHEAAVVGQA